MAICRYYKLPSLVDSLINIDPIYLKLKYACVPSISHKYKVMKKIKCGCGKS